MDFKDVLESCQAEALAAKMLPDEISVFRSFCRSYSKRFSTPLHLCLDGTIPPEDIMLAEFEEQLEEVKLEDNLEMLLDKIYVLQDPTYERQKKAELEDFIVQAEREEAERIKKGRPIHRSMKDEPTLKTTSEKAPKLDKKLPTGGSINLSYLEKLDNQSGGYEE